MCKYNFAVSELEYYINNEVDKPFAYSILAYAHYKQGNVQKSVECYQEAIKLDIRFKNDIDSIEHILFGLDEIKEIFNKIIYEIESS